MSNIKDINFLENKIVNIENNVSTLQEDVSNGFSQDMVDAGIQKRIDDGTIGNLTIEDASITLEKLDKTLSNKITTIDVVKDSLKIENVNYTNSFYNETYSNKTVSSDYPYQAIGGEKTLSSGKYLVYFDVDLTVTSLNAEVLTAMTGKQIYTGDYSEGSGAKSELITDTKAGVIAYSIVNLTQEDNIRPVVWLRHKDTSTTPSCTIKVNKCFVIKMDTIKSEIIETIKNNSNSEYITVSKVGVDFNTFAIKEEVGIKSKVVDCIGDSLTYGVGSSTIKGGYPTRLQTKLGSEWIVNNYGVGGETSHTIAGRAGGLRPIVQPSFTIPATVTASLEFEIKVDNGNLFDCKDLTIDNANVNPCSINGITGTLIKGSANGKYTFTRAEAGEEVVINRPTTLVTNLSRRKGNVLIIYMGQNDGNYNKDYLELVERCRKTVDIAQTDRYIILGMTTGSYNTNGNDDRKNMEEAMYKEFGRHYINLREYMATPIYDTDSTTITSCYSLDDLGLDATDKDINNYIPNGYIPMDLITTDGTHGTDGYYDIVSNLIYERGKELLYW